MKKLAVSMPLLLLLLCSCAGVTVLRTKEIKEASDSSAAIVNKRLDSLMLIIDSLKSEQSKNLLRLRAEFAELNSKLNEQGDKAEARMEEITFRLDRLLGSQQKKGKPATPAKAEAEPKNTEMESLYNASRSDYLRGEYAIAYNGFKQIYESIKTGELAENSLYWMGICMLEAGKKDNAETLFKSLLEKYPQSLKVCTVIFKLATMAEESKNAASQKAYLQKLLGTEHCVASNEFQRAAEILGN